jgi:hypothetical protein
MFEYLFCFSFRNKYQCQDVKDELKRVKRQLKEKNGGPANPERMYIRVIFYLIDWLF